MTFCTEGMYRGYITKEGEGKTFIYKDMRIVRFLEINI